jgi:UDP-N-acetylmuramate dehydrogenase
MQRWGKVKMQNELVEELKMHSIDLRHRMDLSEWSYMRTGGQVDVLILPRSVEQLLLAIRCCAKYKQAYRVMGATSNVLFLDNVSYGFLISTVHVNSVSVDNNVLVADCGALLGEVSRSALRANAKGFEGLEGIPGTVGGAVVMNAGAYGSEIKDVLLRIECCSSDGKLQIMDASALGMKYRNSILRGRRDIFVIRAFFVLQPGCEADIYAKMELYHSKRHRYQEQCYPNLGSIFSGDVYSNLAKQDRIYRLLLAIYNRMAYKYKILGRESPINRIWLNRILARRYRLEEFSNTFSRKTLNCMVNTGQGTDKMVAYIRALEKATLYLIPVENEIVTNWEVDSE